MIFNFFKDVHVKWKPLGKLVKIKHGKDWKRLKSGDIPVYGTGGIIGYVDTYVYEKPTVLIPRKGSITNIFYLEYPFWNISSIYYTVIDETQIIPKFLYHYLKTIDLAKLNNSPAMPSLTIEILNKIEIPIPSLTEQERVVSILERFDSITQSAVEGLPKEATLRKKQYEYYRDQLLSFPKP